VTGNVLLFPVRSKGEFWAVFCKYCAASPQCTLSHRRKGPLLASSQKQILPPKHARISTGLHGVTFQDMVLFVAAWADFNAIVYKLHTMATPQISKNFTKPAFIALCAHKEQLLVAGFETLTAVIMKSSIFWDITPLNW
jgi:hypothetical protein